jgi:hypothetical protein
MNAPSIEEYYLQEALRIACVRRGDDGVIDLTAVRRAVRSFLSLRPGVSERTASRMIAHWLVHGFPTANNGKPMPSGSGAG